MVWGKSFRTQGLNGIDERGAPRRQQTCDERDRGQNHRDREHCSEIGRTNSEKQTLQQTPAGKDTDQTKENPGADETHALKNDKAKHVVALRAERETNSDFLRA